LLQFYLCQDYEMVEHFSHALSCIHYENQTYLMLDLQRL
jgi:thiaminase